MITIKKKKFFLTLTENWFGYKFKWSDLFLPVCYRGLRETNQHFYFGVRKDTQSAVLPLDKPMEDIHSNFFTSIKRDIKKAEAEGVHCYFNDDVKEFIEFYNDFAKSKNLDTLDINRKDEFSIPEWRSSCAVLNGQLLVVHSYLEDKESGIVRSMQSGSLRLNDNYNPRQIAQANKLLHYHDIKYFKERGLSYYDFGGWDNLPGLLEFKQSFGAFPINTFNFYTYAYYLKQNLTKILNPQQKNDA